jgi:sec-independent protein translocase protein TatC
MNKKLSLLINFEELKYRTNYVLLSFLLTFFTCFVFKIELFFIISQFFLNFEDGFIYTNLLDPLIFYIKICFLFSFIISFPIYIYILSFFLFKSIYTFYIFYILSYIFSFYIIGLILFIFCYYKLFPFILNFLLEFQRFEDFNPLKLVLKATIDKYFIFFFGFVFLFFIIFFISNLFLFLMYFNIFNEEFYIKYHYRKYLYLIIIIIFLVVSPPDVLIQLMILPSVCLCIEIIIYFISY